MTSRRRIALAVAAATAVAAGSLAAQDQAIDEIVVVGSQIRGASISEVLAVSVISEQDIEALGVNSGDELLEFMAGARPELF
jgi:outer membrane cobalamin receptor